MALEQLKYSKEKACRLYGVFGLYFCFHIILLGKEEKRRFSSVVVTVKGIQAATSTTQIQVLD